MMIIENGKEILNILRDAVEEKADFLGELDGRSGDGDLGLSMKAAFTAMIQVADDYAGESLSEMLMKAALACNKAAPSTMGTLISAGVMGLAKLTKGLSTLDDAVLVQMPRAFADAIAKRGKAQRGDKTILDALYPMAEAVEESFANGRSVKEAFRAGAEAAEEAANATAGMKAKIGRASWLGDRAAENPDAGAMLCAVLAQALAIR